MKKVNSTNYRKFYKQYYGIEFGKDFNVHHIDRNRENCKMANLILLPQRVHLKYHSLESVVSSENNKGHKLFHLATDSYTNSLFNHIGFLDVLNAIRKWNDLKDRCDFLLSIDNREDAIKEYQTAIDEWRAENEIHVI